MTHFLPTRKSVEAAWDRYSAFARAIALDPMLRNDNDAMSALERAHQRWAVAYIAWCRG